MKFRRLWFYISLLIGGLAFVAKRMEKKPRFKLRWWRVLWGVFLVSVLLIGWSVGQVFTKADSRFTTQIEGCGVVFGAAVWRGSQPSWALDDRVQSGIELYKNGQVKCLIFSGGESTYGDHEADVMRQIALQNGVPDEDIALDYNGINTLATVLNLPADQDQFVFVSNDFHLARIGLMAWKEKVGEYHLHAADYQQGRYLKNDQYFLREMVGYLLILFGL